MDDLPESLGMIVCESQETLPDDTVSIADALSRGGIDDGVSRRDLLALFRGMVDAERGTGTSGATSLLGKLTDGTLDLDRAFGAAVFDQRVAVLGLDRPVAAPATPPALRLVFLDSPLPGTDTGRGIDTLFLLIGSSPTGEWGLRQRLLTLLDLQAFRHLLTHRPSGASLIDSVRTIESTLAPPTN